MVTTAEKLDRAREYVMSVLTNPALLEESFKARQHFGPAYGYADRAEWWDAQVSFYPELFEGDDAIVRPEGWLLPTFTGSPIFTDTVKKAETVNLVAEPVTSAFGIAVSEAPVPADPKGNEAAIYDFLREYKGTYPFLLSLQQWVLDGKTLTEKQYAAAEKCWQREQEFTKKPDQPKKKMLEEDGIYYKDGVVYKVVHAKQGSNKPYAKTLNNQYGTWTYAGQGPLWDLTEDDRMTLEAAKEFGKLYGMCCNCGATLTDENSIEDGIGPVCKKKFL